MFLAADWAKLITDEKGRLMVRSTVEALSDYRACPLLKYLLIQNVMGSAYIANRAGASAQAATRPLGSDFTESAPTVLPYTFPMRPAGGQIKIDKAMIRMDNTGSIEAGLMTRKLWDIGARLFRLCFNGDGANASEFTGFNKFCADDGRVIHNAGAPINADVMDAALLKVPGANLILANGTLANNIDRLDQKVRPVINIDSAGQRPDMYKLNYKGIPIVPVQQAPNDTTAVQEEILPFTEADGSGHNTASRVTILRMGLDGVYGGQNAPMELGNPYELGAFRYRDLSWIIALIISDMLDALIQVDQVTPL